MVDTNATDLLHRAWKSYDGIQAQIERLEWESRGILAQIKESEAWKEVNPKWRTYLVEDGRKPSKIDLDINLAKRFGEYVKTMGKRVCKSRLGEALAIEFSSPIEEKAFIDEYCIVDVPSKAYKARLREIKNLPDTDTCDHMAGREYWCKCKKCSTWIPDPVK